MAKRAILVLPLGLSACISISTESSVDVTSSKTQTFVHLEIPNKSIEFNWHGGGWWNGVDRYMLKIPRGLDHATGKDIQMVVGTAEIPQSLSDASEIWISGRGQCQIKLSLFDAKGQPFTFNGTYKTALECNR